jgi:hypothetical protein
LLCCLVWLQVMIPRAPTQQLQETQQQQQQGLEQQQQQGLEQQQGLGQRQDVDAKSAE